jgi:hypothetical protein
VGVLLCTRPTLPFRCGVRDECTPYGFQRLQMQLIGLGIPGYQVKRYEGRMRKGGTETARLRGEHVLEPAQLRWPVTTQASE